MATPADTPYGTIAVPIQENEPGHDVPTGGTTGQVLSKVSNTDYDTAWEASTQIVSPNALFNVNDTGVGYGYWGINVDVTPGADPNYNINNGWFVIPIDTAHNFAAIDALPPSDPTPGGLFLAVIGKALGVVPPPPLHAGWAPLDVTWSALNVGNLNPTVADIQDLTADNQLVCGSLATIMRMSDPVATLTVTLRAIPDWPVGGSFRVLRYGAGAVAIAAGGGTTIVTPRAGLSITDRYGSATITKMTETEWLVDGDLS